MSFSDFLENEVLDHLFGAQTYTPPGTLYLALSSTAPNDDGSNVTEPSGNGYARIGVTNNATEWPAAVSGVKNNANPIVFAQATGSWGDPLTHWCLFDAVSGGNFLGAGELTDPTLIDNGDDPTIPAGEIAIALD